MAGLPRNSRHDARVVLTRLDSEPKFNTKPVLKCSAPLPPDLQPSLIWMDGGGIPT
jgi:hypothetical protein